jgi:hypothetical protein
MSRGFYDWLGDGVGGKSVRKSGAVVALDHNQKPVARLEFAGAIVKSLLLPTLDRSANKDAFMTVSISPEATKSTDSGQSASLGVYVSRLPKPWDIASFKLGISGLESDCAHVTYIQSIELKQWTYPRIARY